MYKCLRQECAAKLLLLQKLGQFKVHSVLHFSYYSLPQNKCFSKEMAACLLQVASPTHWPCHTGRDEPQRTSVLILLHESNQFESLPIYWQQFVFTVALITYRYTSTGLLNWPMLSSLSLPIFFSITLLRRQNYGQHLFIFFYFYSNQM